MSSSAFAAQGQTGFAGRIPRDQVDRERTLRRLRTLATLLDTAIRLPGGIRIGADSVIGLAPGVGDALSMALAAYIVYEADRLGVPANKLWRMLGNVVIDGLVGAVPVLGDIFDVAFKANIRNLRIIEEHLSQHGRR
jgi:hypothetical protein